MLRLALNVASTRIILMEGHTARRRLERWSKRSVTSSLVAIRYRYRGVCHSRDHQLYGHYQGAGRIAEVGARFVLDGMPGSRWRLTPTLTPD